MASFAVAYLLVLLAVVLYVARLGVEQRRLARELESLRMRQDSASNHGRPGVRAA